MSYPPEHLFSQRRRVTSLPLISFYGGLGELAPAIDWETRERAWDIADHHRTRHVIEHQFGGDEQAYLTYLKVFSDKRSTSKPAGVESPVGDPAVPVL